MPALHPNYGVDEIRQFLPISGNRALGFFGTNYQKGGGDDTRELIDLGILPIGFPLLYAKALYGDCLEDAAQLLNFSPKDCGYMPAADLMQFSMGVVLSQRPETSFTKDDRQIYQHMQPHLIDLLRLYPADDDAIESLAYTSKRLAKRKRDKVDTGQLADDETLRLAIDFYKTLEENIATFPKHVQTILSPVFE